MVKQVDDFADTVATANPKSVKQFGHTFTNHGQGAKNTQRLKDRARGTGKDQGQFLDNQAAANFLSDLEVTKVTDIPIPDSLSAQVIKPDGSIVAATHVRVVPKAGGGYRSAFPVTIN